MQGRSSIGTGVRENEQRASDPSARFGGSSNDRLLGHATATAEGEANHGSKSDETHYRQDPTDNECLRQDDVPPGTNTASESRWQANHPKDADA